MSSSHIHLGADALPFDANGCVVFSDPAHSQLILLKKNAYYTLSILDGPGATLSDPITAVERGNVLCVKMSLDRRFLAVQRSSTDVDVVDLETSDQWTARIRAKGGNQLLCDGVIWSEHSTKPGSSQDLVLVTSHGLEFFKVSAAKRTLKHIRNLNNKVVCFWYEPVSRVALLALGSQAAHRIEFDARPYQLAGTAPVKLPRLQLPGPLAQKDVTLLRLYGSLFCAHVDTEAARLMLHRIGIGGGVVSGAMSGGGDTGGSAAQSVQGQVSLCLQLYMPGSFELSVIDNLLVCHSRDSRVSLLFDVQSPSSDPLVNPLPVALRAQRGNTSFLWKGQPEALAAQFRGSSEADASELVGGSANGEGEGEGEAGATSGAVGTAGVYASNWSFLAPMYAIECCAPPDDALASVSSANGGDTPSAQSDGAAARATFRRIWTLHVSLPEVVTSSSNLQSLLPLLLRRGQLRMSASVAPTPRGIVAAAEETARRAKEVLLRLLLTLVVEESTLPLLSAVFDSLNEGYLKAMVERAWAPASASDHGRLGGAASEKQEKAGGAGETGDAACGDDGGSLSPRFRLLSWGSTKNSASTAGERKTSKQAPSAKSGLSAASAGTDGGRDGNDVGHTSLEPPSHVCSALLSRWIDQQQSRADGRPGSDGTSRVVQASPPEPPETGEPVDTGVVDGADASPPRKLVKRYSSGLLYGRKADGADSARDRDVELACKLSTARNSRGHMVVLQTEMLAHVLLPAAADTERVRPRYLIALLAEYLRSLQRNYIPAQQALHELLAELLAAEGRLVELYQLLQYRISSDSPVLALRLLEIGAGIDITAEISTDVVTGAQIMSKVVGGCLDANSSVVQSSTQHCGSSAPLCQLALDMLFRLRLHEHLVCALLALGRLQPAMRVARGSKDEMLSRYGSEGQPTRKAFAQCMARRFFQVATLHAYRAVLEAVIARAGPLPDGSVEARSAAAEAVFHSLYAFFREWEPALLRPAPKGIAVASSASPNHPSGNMPPLFRPGCDQSLPPLPEGLFLPKKGAELRRMFGFAPKPRSPRT